MSRDLFGETSNMPASFLSSKHHDDSVKTLTQLYDDRIKDLSQTLVRTLHQMQSDEVLAMLHKDSASGPFIKERISEILEGTVSMERELMLKTVMQKLSVQTAEHQQLKLEWNSLVEKIKAREAIIEEKDTNLQRELLNARNKISSDQKLIDELQRNVGQMERNTGALNGNYNNISQELKEKTQNEAILQKEVTRLTQELKDERQLRKSTAEEYEDRLRQILAKKDLQMEAHLTEWKSQLVYNATNNEQKLRQLLEQKERQTIDEKVSHDKQYAQLNSKYILLEKEKQHIEERLREQSRYVEGSVNEELRKWKELAENSKAKQIKLERSLADVQSDASRLIKDQNARFQEVVSKYQLLRQKTIETEGLLEKSEQERLEIRSKYLKLGEKLEGFVEEDRFEAKQIIGKERSRVSKLQKKIEEERNARRLDHEKFKKIITKHEEQATTYETSLKESKKKIILLQEEMEETKMRLNMTDKLTNAKLNSMLEEHEKMNITITEKNKLLSDEVDQLKIFNRKLDSDIHMKENEYKEKISEMKVLYERRLEDAHKEHRDLMTRSGEHTAEQFDAKTTHLKHQIENQETIIKGLKVALGLRDSDLSRTHVPKEQFARDIEDKLLSVEKEWEEKRKHEEKMMKERHLLEIEQLKEKSLHEFKENTHELRSNVEKLEERLERSRQQNSKLTSELDTKQLQIDNLTKQNNSLKLSQNDAKRDIQSNEEQIKNNENERIKINKELEDVRSKSMRLEDENRIIISKLAVIEEEKKFSQSEMNRLKDILQEKRTECTNTLRELNDIQHEKEQLLSKTVTINEQMQRDSLLLQEARKIQTSAEQSMHGLEMELQAKTKECKQMVEDIRRLENEVETSKKKSIDKSKMNENDRKHFESKLNTQQRTIDDLKSQLQTVQNDLRRTSDQANDQKLMHVNRISSMEQNIHTLKTEKSQLDNVMLSMQKQESELKTTISNKDREILSIKHEKEMIENRLESIEKTLESHKNDYKTVLSERDSLKDQSNNVEQIWREKVDKIILENNDKQRAMQTEHQKCLDDINKMQQLITSKELSEKRNAEISLERKENEIKMEEELKISKERFKKLRSISVTLISKCQLEMQNRIQAIRKEKNDIKNQFLIETNNISHYISDQIRLLNNKYEQILKKQKIMDEKNQKDAINRKKEQFQNELKQQESKYHNEIQQIKDDANKNMQLSNDKYVQERTNIENELNDIKNNYNKLKMELENKQIIYDNQIEKKEKEIYIKYENGLKEERQKNTFILENKIKELQESDKLVSELKGRADQLSTELSSIKQQQQSNNIQLDKKTHTCKDIIHLITSICPIIPPDVTTNIMSSNDEIALMGLQRLTIAVNKFKEEFKMTREKEQLDMKNNLKEQEKQAKEAKKRMEQTQKELEELQLSLTTRQAEYDRVVEELRDELETTHAENLLNVELSKVAATQNLKNEVENLRKSLLEVQVNHEQELKDKVRETERKLREQKRNFEERMRVEQSGMMENRELSVVHEEEQDDEEFQEPEGMFDDNEAVLSDSIDLDSKFQTPSGKTPLSTVKKPSSYKFDASMSLPMLNNMTQSPPKSITKSPNMSTVYDFKDNTTSSSSSFSVKPVDRTMTLEERRLKMSQGKSRNNNSILNKTKNDNNNISSLVSSLSSSGTTTGVTESSSSQQQLKNMKARLQKYSTTMIE